MPTIQTGIGQSHDKDPLRAAQEAVQQAKINLHSDHLDLAFVFTTAGFSSAALLKTIATYTEETPIIGSSSAAIISAEGIAKEGLVIMLLSFPEGVYFNTASVKKINTTTAQAAGGELGAKLLYGFRDVRRDLGIIFSDGLIKDSSSFILSLEEKLGTSFPLVGASASDNLSSLKTYLHFNQEVFSNGACGVLLGGKLNFGLGIKHGWQPLGKPRRITKARGNVVYAIDGVAASKLYEKYFAYSLNKLREELKLISVLYPIGIYLPGEKEYLLRNIVSLEDDGSILFQGDVPEDSEIRLMIGTKESALEATEEAMACARGRLAGHTINFVLIFDSISRYVLLGRDAHKELELIKKGLKADTPIIGLYTYGEQAPLEAINYRGRCYFHNQTITILAVGG